MRAIWNERIQRDKPLWRYFRTNRFIAALESRTLHFASARQFNDPFEGAVAVLPQDWPNDPRYPELGFGDDAFEQLRRLTKISCWHQADYESAAMWKLYAESDKGVAVRTTTNRIQRGLLPFRLDPSYDRAFEWEREFRIAVSVRSAEEFGVQVPEFGIDVPFDPSVTIESVYLGPALGEADRRRIREACAVSGLRCNIVTSTLLGRPRYI